MAWNFSGFIIILLSLNLLIARLLSDSKRRIKFLMLFAKAVNVLPSAKLWALAVLITLKKSH